MPDDKPSSLDKLKAFVALVREAVIVVILLLLLLFPRAIKSVLTRSGFTEVSIAGFKWERELEDSLQQTKDATQSVIKLEEQLQKASDQLEQIRASAPPAVGAQISTLSANLERTRSETRTAKDNLQNSLAVQRSIMQKFAPTRPEAIQPGPPQR